MWSESLNQRPNRDPARCGLVCAMRAARPILEAMTSPYPLLLTGVLLAGCASQQGQRIEAITLGSTPPSEPQLVDHGPINSGLGERDATLSPDGNTFAWTVTHRRESVIVMMNRVNGSWGEPYIAPFSGLHADLEPCFSPHSGALWFCSQRPLPGESEAGDWNLWRVWPQAPIGPASSWGAPVAVDALNTEGDEFYPSITKDGRMCFTATRTGGLGGEDIWLAQEMGPGEDGWDVRNAGPSINTSAGEFNSCLHPTGCALVFGSDRSGGGDLFVSRFREGAWLPSSPLEIANSPGLDYCPSFSPDGATFWFTSRRSLGRSHGDLRHWRSHRMSPGNGLDDLYWVTGDWATGD